MRSYDIFISYRRVGGADKARTIKAELELQGFHVFLDFDELKDGVFDQRIIHAIESAPIFMMILTPHALDRCMDEQDWVRREIEYAIAQQKHVVPVNADRSFDGFDAQLPSSIKEGLGLHQFSEVMFGQLFKESVAKMIRDRIRPVLEQNADRSTAVPSGVGALIHLETDVDCRIYRFGKEVTVALKGEDTVIRLMRGKHKLEFVSLQNEADRLSMLYAVPENDFEDLLTIELLAVQQKRERLEVEQAAQEKAEKERLAAEKAEKERLAVEQAAKEKAEQERLAAEKAEQERREREAREVAEKAERERLAREEAARQAATKGTINGHEWVDLGLSVKWATCNVGASSSSAYGNYYAWGEISPKSTYTEKNSVTYKKSMGNIVGSSYDAARANWGGSWRLPTQAEFQELIDKCTWTWTSQDGHNGYKVTGKNGNSIFLLATGWRGRSSLIDAGEGGTYWSSTPYESDSQRAYCLYFLSGCRYHDVHWYDRRCGLTVRPVSE